ncbi:unnamed protein product [Microthlaspi erraticum]|uniref:Retrotransposon gag domain-containing protein n=1 Tax=Microthlaspi erraticum TaxID=1685480 RepID=A0A6D2JTC1_9BRAS|nr:unnamed protein product [Microthlaspi erraticum]
MSHAADRAQRWEAMNRARSIPRHAIKASGRTHRSTRKANDYGRPRSSPHDQDHHITADPDGRRHPLHASVSWPREEQPIDHIEKFEEICATRRCSGVSEDYLKCTLFSFSLVEKAYKWMKALPAGSITTWDEYKRAFLKNFYPKERLKWMRRRISEFRHEAHESFFEAVSRFKEYKRECPHHGFTEIALLNFFYQGVDEKFKMALNIASQGDFMTNTILKPTFSLITWLQATNILAWTMRKTWSIKPSSDFSEILELKSMVAQFLKNQQRDAYQCENGSFSW